MNNTSDNNNQPNVISTLQSLGGQLAGILFLFVLIVPILLAPMIGYYIRGNLMVTYNLSENSPELKRKMFPVWIILWIVAIIGWSVVIGIQCDNINNHGYCYKD